MIHIVQTRSVVIGSAHISVQATAYPKLLLPIEAIISIRSLSLASFIFNFASSVNFWRVSLKGFKTRKISGCSVAYSER